jgi:hypothetical protein
VARKSSHFCCRRFAFLAITVWCLAVHHLFEVKLGISPRADLFVAFELARQFPLTLAGLASTFFVLTPLGGIALAVVLNLLLNVIILGAIAAIPSVVVVVIRVLISLTIVVSRCWALLTDAVLLLLQLLVAALFMRQLRVAVVASATMNG